MPLDRTLFEISIKESDKGREYWLSRPWLEDRRTIVQQADVLIVPWENFRENEPALYPKGSSDFINDLSATGSLSMELAVDEEHYYEIMLHSKLDRFPTMLVTLVALPALAGMLGNLMTNVATGGNESGQVKMKLIVEGEYGRCVSLDYEGPPTRLAETLLQESHRCFPEPRSDKAIEQNPVTDRNVR